MHATATGHWKRGFDRMSDRDLFDLDDQIKEVVALPGWERIVAWIGAGHDAVLTSLTQGATRSHADYARQIGYLGGLEEAPNVVKAIRDAASQRRAKRESEAAVADSARQEGTPQ